MKILFSPSESKSELENTACIDENSFIFKELFGKRKVIIKAYNDFVLNADTKALARFFELKNEAQIKALQKDIFTQKSCTAILRYTGVAFSYLNFNELNTAARDYVLENTLIFSNLFGPILAKDSIPNYKLKQGAKLENINIESFYKKEFSKALDAFLEGDEILDLRAGFYEKFYTPKKEFYTYKFIKNGKVVSHFAKAYRGILLRQAALINAKTNAALLESLPENLNLLELQKQGLKTQVVLEILE